MNGKSFRAARKYGYRSGLEVKLATYLKEQGVLAEYESMKIEWEDLTYRTYTPDFILPNGIVSYVRVLRVHMKYGVTGMALNVMTGLYLSHG